MLRRMRATAAFVLSFASCFAACADDEQPGQGTGALPQSACDRALVVLQTDYASSRVAVTRLDGSVLSSSLISSAGTTVGLSSALSGDVVLPTTKPLSGRVVLLDRFPNSVLTWIAPEEGTVVGQLSVATGFPSNPHDYVEISDTKAYVSRYESNANPGRAPFDNGGDLLIVDPRARAITGNVVFSAVGTILPRPDRMASMPALQMALVLLQRFDRTFSANMQSELVAVDTSTDQVLWSQSLGADGCGGIASSPFGNRVVVTCAGALRNRKATSEGSALVAFDLTRTEATMVRRIEAAALGEGSPFGNGVGFLGEGSVLSNALGDLESGKPDRLFEVNLADGTLAIVTSSTNAFAFGDIMCASTSTTTCTTSRRCFVADAASASVRAYESATQGGATQVLDFSAASSTTLPPRSLTLL